MAKRTITDRALKALKAAHAGRRYEIMDAVVPGLGIRVTDKGRRTFILVARYPGSPNPTRRALGEYGVLTLEEARKKARAWLELIGKGIDPKTQAERQRREEQRRQANSFEAVAEEFIVRHVAKLRTGGEIEAAIRRELLGQSKRKMPDGAERWDDDPKSPRWRDRPITDITRHDVVDALDRLARRGTPYAAHHLLAFTRKLFNWALGRGVYGLEHSPCDRLKPSDVIGKRMDRTRTLTDAELRHVWQAAEEAGYPLGPLARLLILTGQRRSEIAEARWSEIDFDKALLAIPAIRMKADRPHVVPLAPEAVDILKALPRWNDDDFIFTTTGGRRPISGFAKMKLRLDKLVLERMRKEALDRGQDPDKVELEGWRLHDLRRTARTHFSAIPSQDLVRELVIGHARPGLHRVYDQYAYLDERRDLLERWAVRLRAIVAPTPVNVIALRA